MQTGITGTFLILFFLLLAVANVGFGIALGSQIGAVGGQHTVFLFGLAVGIIGTLGLMLLALWQWMQVSRGPGEEDGQD